MSSGCPADVFAREIGLTEEDLAWLATRRGRQLEGDAGLMWGRVLLLLNRKLGEIIEVRAQVERRYDKLRRAKIRRRRHG